MDKKCTIWLKDYDLVYARKEIKRPSTLQSVSLKYRVNSYK